MADEFTQIVQDVQKEIKAIGALSEEHYSKFKNELNELRREVDKTKSDPLQKERIDKLAEAATTRQEEMEKKFKEVNKRQDDFELAWQKAGASSAKAEITLEERKAATTFLMTKASRKGINTIDEKVEATDEQVLQLREYEKCFREYMAKGEDKRYNLSPEAVKTMIVGIDPDGGYFCPPQMSNRIIQKIFETDPIRELARVETISANELEIATETTDDIGTGWVGEVDSRAETATTQIGLTKIVAHEMYAMPKVSQKLIEDAAVNVEAWLANKVGEKFGRVEAEAFINGQTTGVNEPRGILTYDDGTSWNQIEQVEMGAAAAITADGFANIKYALPEYYMNRGTWIMNRATVRDVVKLKDGEGNYLWRESFRAGEPSVILGQPVRMSTSMPVVAANALAVAYADWQEAYLIVDRLGITILRDPYSSKPFILYYTRKRVGGQVVNFQAIKLGYIHV